MKRIGAAFFALALLAVPVLAEDQKGDEPTSPKAGEAKVAYGVALKKAEADFAKAQADAAKTYADRLQEAMKLALKAEKPDLPEINRIDAKIKELQAALPATQPGGFDFRWLMGVKYTMNGEVMTFSPNHTVTARNWKGTWAVVDANTLAVHVSGDVKANRYFTFSKTRMAAMEEYLTGGGGGNVWTRVEK